MHPITPDEEQTTHLEHYGVYVRMLVSQTLAKINDPTRASGYSTIGGDIHRIVDGRIDVAAVMGSDWLLDATISADLDNPCVEATIHTQLVAIGDPGSPGGAGISNLSPFYAGPAWDIGQALNNPGRPLLDAGVYVALEAKLVSSIPRTIIPNPPFLQAVGSAVATTSPDGASVPWPPHRIGDRGYLFVQTSNQAPTLDIPAGFAAIATPQGIGAASGGTGVVWGISTEFTGTANPTTASFTLPTGTRGVVVWIIQPIVSTDIVTGVTIGGVAMTRAGTVVNTSSTAGGRVYCYFLGSGVPAAGARTINVSRSQTTTTVHVVAEALTGTVDMEVVDIDSQASANGSPIADPHLTLQYNGRLAIGLVAMYSNLDNVLGTGTESTGQSRVQDHDFGTETSLVSRQTTPGTSDFTMGWTMNAGQIAQMAIAVAEIASTATRLDVYEAVASSSAMASPHISQPGDHFLAFIATVRGAATVAAVEATIGNTAAQSASVVSPGVTASAKALILHCVAAATDTTTSQFSAWSNPRLGFSTGDFVIPAQEKADIFRNNGLGGGIGIFVGPMQNAGATGTATATLATPSVQARITLSIKPPPVHEVTDRPEDIPWRPFFVGRIDSVDPGASDEKIELHCRDITSDMLDRYVVVPIELAGLPVIMPAEDIGELLSIYAQYPSPAEQPIPFRILGSPVMTIPEAVMEPESQLLAMRRLGLQNGFDLRGRFGTSELGDDVFVLTYYDPDRAKLTQAYQLLPSNYFSLRTFSKTREDVRNRIRVTVANADRTIIEVTDLDSIAKYGDLYLGISEDTSSLITVVAQGQALANAALSDLSEPKVGGEIEMRFFPWVEINDLIDLVGDGIVLGRAQQAVSGYEHHLTSDPDADQVTILRTRPTPAAANFDYKRDPQRREYISTKFPVGTAIEGATWSVVDEA